MTTIYLIILGLAFAATLTFAGVWVHDRSAAWRPTTDPSADAAARRRWDDGAVDQLLVTFPAAAGGLLLGLVLSGAEIDVGGLGAEAMLLAAGATAAQRLVARRRGEAGARAALSLVLCLAAGAGVIGGIAAPGG